MKRKILSAVLTAGMVMGPLMGNNVTSVQAAKSIALNTQYNESISHEQKIYTFKMPSSGYFYYTITPVYYTDNGETVDSSSWYIRHEMDVNYKQYENEDSYYSDGTWRSYRYNFKKGTKVQIKVSEDSAREYVWYYKLKVHTGKVKNFEKESNGTRSKANAMKVNKTYTGNVTKDDLDWWSFKAPKTGRYKISGVVSDIDYYATNKDRSNGYSVHTYSYNGYRLNNDTYIDDTSGYKTVFSGKVKKGKKVYVKIIHDNGFLTSSDYDVFYKLKVRRTK